MMRHSSSQEWYSLLSRLDDQHMISQIHLSLIPGEKNRKGEIQKQMTTVIGSLRNRHTGGSLPSRSGCRKSMLRSIIISRSFSPAVEDTASASIGLNWIPHFQTAIALRATQHMNSSNAEDSCEKDETQRKLKVKWHMRRIRAINSILRGERGGSRRLKWIKIPHPFVPRPAFWRLVPSKNKTDQF